jgi:hypothetical protein
MHLARLDNEVFFKKAFTDRIVFIAFVKDIVGIDINPPVIETEKSFAPKVGNVGFKFDIFADDPELRVIIEIQKVEYDHNFNRFLHYHIQGIAEQQRTAEDYGVKRTVYTIVVMTAPYRINKTTGEVFKDEVLISTLNPRNLAGVERPLFNHKLIFLNPNYKDDGTPSNYRDWLDLIYESIHHPENPSINNANIGVARAASLVQLENMSPDELEQSKIEVGKKQVLEIMFEDGMGKGIDIGMEKGKEEEKVVGIKKALKRGKLTVEEIAEDFEVTVEFVLGVEMG